MVATSTRRRQSTVSPAVAAQWTVWTFVIVNGVIVEVLFSDTTAGTDATLEAARFFGVQAALLVAFQLLLVARMPWLDRRLGMDRLTVWHRWVGFGLLWTVLTHAVLIVFAYASLANTSTPKTFLTLTGVPASLLGMLASAVMFAVGVTSARPLRRRLRYEVWHGLHLLLYLALGLTFVHQLLETTTFASSAFATAYWWALWLFAFGALLTGRVVVPVWRNAYHRFRVSAVKLESDDVVTVYVTGRHLHRLPARAGQFFVWRFLGHNHWWPANPFSLSAAPDGFTLRLTAKAVGSASASLRQLPIGTRAFLEGPYGALTSLHRSHGGALLIAGGMGITPIRALLEEESIGDDVIVLYRVRTESDVVLGEEVRDLVAMCGGRLHLLTGRSQEGARPFAPNSLRALVPDVAERDVYMCGPTAMTSTVLDSLRELQVPAGQIHTEKFNLA
ncbi:ferric reductase-like transmembrane domain-containing protein [Streptomyces sp. NPDC088847]|uniref:ferredoxin reductase family protein n=1 Tax=Streptomyces sp. NPDC088847 TaxID=3365909 RepID=UPI00380E9A4E